MGKSTTKAELISAVAEKSGMTKFSASQAINAVIDVVTAELVAGNTVSLPGLAKFEVRARPARKVRNVATGEMMDKDADFAVKISAMSAIKAAVNGA